MSGSIFNRFNPTNPAPKVEEDSGTLHRRTVSSGEFIREADLMAAIDHIPALPVVVNKILALVGDKDSSAADLEALIKLDMVIAARLLHLVNSPFYGLGHNVESISQAVALVGYASMKSLMLAASVSNVLTSADMAAYGFSDKGLWKNSMATAALSRAIAKQINLGNQLAEEYFVAGLMRDIGMLVMVRFLVQKGVSLRKRADKGADILRQERETTGFDHCYVGDLLAQKWLLPPRLRMCIAKHHRVPTSATSTEMRQLAGIRLAERLSYTSGIGLISEHPFDAHIDGVLVQAAGLDAAGFQELVKKVPSIIAGTEVNIL
jgi:HD-like signal output (HDOD) protein